MYKSYTHVERLGKPETEGLLQNAVVYVTAKLDGTNAVVWFEDGEAKAGSRNRDLSTGSDNGGFRAWLLGDSYQAIRLRKFVEENPQMIVYGEWMGLNKFLGHIKHYSAEAQGRMVIFDIYNTMTEEYMPEKLWRSMLEECGLLEYATEILAVLCNPTEEQILEVAENNRYLLKDGAKGEGVVCRVDGWLNSFGKQVRGKLVLDEFKQIRKEKQTLRADIEPAVVERYVTESELNKTLAKVLCRLEADVFDNKSGKHIGIMLQTVYKDCVLSECENWVKEFKDPKIDFKILKQLVFAKTREFLGL